MKHIYRHKWKELDYSIMIQEAHSEYIICKVVSHIMKKSIDEIVMITNRDFNLYFNTNDCYDELEALLS